MLSLPKNILPIAVFSMMMGALPSCTNLYIQKSVFVPLMREEGEMKAEITCGREGGSLNTCYAVSDRFSMMLNGFGSFSNSKEYDRKYNFQLEAGMGYYKMFQDSFRYESFVGFSRGWLSSNYQRPVEDFSRNLDIGIFSPRYAGFGAVPFLVSPSGTKGYDVNGAGAYYTLFMQHSMGMGKVAKRGNSFIWTFRAQYVKFDRYQETVLTGNQSFRYDVYAPEKIFIQPMITDKIGITPNLNLSLQVGLNFDISDNTSDVFEWNRVFFYGGIEFSLNRTEMKHLGRALSGKGRKNIFQRGY